MFLDVTDLDFDRDVIPFTRNGIILDTSVIKIFIDGLIATRIEKRRLANLPEFKQLTAFFDLIKVGVKFERFIITPHILTEVCSHIRNDYGKRKDYQNVFEHMSPFLFEMTERLVGKEQVLEKVTTGQPIEIGDLSIHVVTDGILNENKTISILAKDRKLNAVYKEHPKVLVMDFENIFYNMV